MSQSSFTLRAIEEALGACGSDVVEQVTLGARRPSYLPLPDSLHPFLKDALRKEYPGGFYQHQALALEALIDGKDVALSTSTASGKSLVFITGALHLLLTDPSASVLAFYPAKALIQDQISKWKTSLTGTAFTVAFIDGTVPVDKRRELLRSNRVVLMTPDVGHAWMMSNLREREIAAFLRSLRLLILDEAHVYEGVFGTNMAYLLRRIDVVAAQHRLICSTATLGRPSDFVYQLTGRQTVSIDQSQDGSAAPEREVLLATDPGFEGIIKLLKRLAVVERGRFLAFSDSRKMVEQIVAATLRSEDAATEDRDDDNEFELQAGTQGNGVSQGRRVGERSERILPFRAGYEADDAREIQIALWRGNLGGVVSTSAMELGLDIGEIDLVLLLNPPPSVKGFWQRLGRAGRIRSGICLLLDTKGNLVNSPGALAKYMHRELEPSWLYLQNRYLQYANVLCAAAELEEVEITSADQQSFHSLPESFVHLLENELNPTEVVPTDLYLLKQRAQAGPHREFPLRSGIETDFKLEDERGLKLGNVTFSQLMREAYPGAIYYYISRPYRVVRMDIHKGLALVRRAKYWTTRPLANTIVFPRFNGGILKMYGDANGFIAEAEVQVSERVVGFQERRGSAKPEQHRYGPESAYYRRELTRFFESTGVCWWFPNKTSVSEDIGARILQAFCVDHGVQERDLGLGIFHSKQSPFGPGKSQGLCIYDAVSGSLRLSQRLAEKFAEVVDSATRYAAAEGAEEAENHLRSLKVLAAELGPTLVSKGPMETTNGESQWTPIIAAGERAIYASQDGPLEVTVLQHLFTPKGLMYSLVPEHDEGKWMVAANALQPMHGFTKLVYVDLMTGEVRDELLP